MDIAIQYLFFLGASPMPHIRKARFWDRSQLAKIFLITRQQDFFWEDTQDQKLSDYKQSVKGEQLWVAIINKQVVGFISIRVDRNFVHNLFVRPDRQRHGIGKALLAEMTQHCTPPLRLKVRVENTKAIGFYQAQGWQLGDSVQDPEGEYFWKTRG